MVEYNYCEQNSRFYRDGDDPYRSWLPTNGKQEELTLVPSLINTGYEITTETQEAIF